VKRHRLTPTESERLQDRLRQASRLLCLLCGRDAIAVGIWIPPSVLRQKLGQPPGKVRFVADATCLEHSGRASLPAIENTLLSETAEDLASPDAN
jgi:hypothetical protein